MPPEPGDDEIIVAGGHPILTIPPAVVRPQDLCGWRRRSHRRRARGIPRRKRPADHRNPARFHQEGTEEPLCQPRRLPPALEGLPTASRPFSTNSRAEGLPLDPSPKRLARISIPSISSATSPSTGSRSPVASAPTTCTSATYSPNTALRPAPCSTRCWRNIGDEGVRRSRRRHTSCRFRPSSTLGTPIQLIKDSATREDFEHAVHELQSALYQEVVLIMSVRNIVKSIQDIMRQDSGVDGDAQRI